MDDRAMEDALRHFRDGQFAALVVAMIGLVARTHPEELRAALAQVFDLKAVEQDARECNATTQWVREKVNEQRVEAEARLQALHEQINRAESRLADVTRRLNRAASFAAKLR